MHCFQTVDNARQYTSSHITEEYTDSADCCHRVVDVAPGPLTSIISPPSMSSSSGVVVMSSLSPSCVPEATSVSTLDKPRLRTGSCAPA